MNAIMLVAQREFRTRMVAKSSIISLVIMCVIMVGAGVVYRIVTGDGTSTTKIAFTTETAVLQQPVQAAATELDQAWTIEAVEASAAEAQKMVQNEEVDYALVGESTEPQLLSNGEADKKLMSLLQGIVQQHAMLEAFAELGGDPDQIATQLAGARVEVVDVSDSADTGVDSADFDMVALIAALVISMILLSAIMGGGQMLAVGVVEEKTSRVVEIILSTIRPTQLLAGKVLGIGLLGLVNMAVMLLSSFAGAYIAGLDIPLGSLSAKVMIWSVVWFLLGYLIYSALYAALAALVSRQEDMGAVITPMLFMQLIPFYVSCFYGIHAPNGIVMQVLSMIPFFTPYTMPVRQAFGAAPGWQLAIAVVASLVVIPLTIWLAGRLYSRGVLHMGSRLKLTKALRRS